MASMPAFLFDLDGTLIDSVYSHVLAWRAALEGAGIELSVWRIHRRIGMHRHQRPDRECPARP
jgi:beta-phosphoglucomutase-like phosphatase (HAD superfamily)